MCSASHRMHPAPAAACKQVAQIAKAAVRAVATDRAILRRLLQLCLPEYLLNSLDIEALIDAMIASTVIEVDIEDPSGKRPPPGVLPPPGAGTKAPPGAAGKSVSLKITQTIPGVKAADVRGCMSASLSWRCGCFQPGGSVCVSMHTSPATHRSCIRRPMQLPL